MKMTAFWDSMPCILAEIDRRFRSLMMEAVSSSETSVNFYEPIYGVTPRRHSSSCKRLMNVLDITVM
jgi:hypothetical protein